MVRIRRRIILVGYSALLFLVLGATAGVLIFFMGGANLNLTDRLAVIGDLLAGGALLLSFIAALLAVQAYAAATGLPSLSVQVWFGASSKNIPVFTANEEENGWLAIGAPNRQTVAQISIYNAGLYSARNPVVVLRLEGMFVRGIQDFAEWAAVDAEEGFGVTGLQWDGGGDYSVHSKSVRKLPTLDLMGLCYVPEWGKPGLRLELLAEAGYRRLVQIPVSISSGVDTGDDEFSAGSWV